MGLLINGQVGWRTAGVVGAQAASPSLVTTGLILHLDAGNSSSYPGTGTSWYDLTLNNLPSILFNGVGYSSNNGGYMVFDGVNDYINGTGNGLYNFTDGTKDIPFTMGGWFYRNDANTFMLLNKGDTGNGTSQAYSVGISSNKLGVTLYDGDGDGGKSITRTMTNTLSTNTWYNWHVTYAGNNGNDPNSANYINIYINGVLQSSTNSTSGVYARMRTLNSSNNLWLGSFGSTGTYKWISNNGRIPQYVIYNRVMSQSEITQNFNALKSRYGL